MRQILDTLPSWQRRLLQIAIDGLIVCIAWTSAYHLRFDGDVPVHYAEQMRNLFLIVVVLKTLINFTLGIYQQRWRYTSLREAATLCVASISASAFFALLRATRLFLVPYAIIIVDWALCILGIAGVRVLRRIQITIWKNRATAASIPTLVVGAGDAAAAFLSDLAKLSKRNLRVIGLLDDDDQKRATRLHGVPVLGATTQIELFIKQHDIRHVIIAMPTVEAAVVRDIIRRCHSCGATVRVIPALGDAGNLTTGRYAVTLADLVETTEIKRTLLGTIDAPKQARTVLVTGGAGYIGNHLVEKLLSRGFRVRVLDNMAYGNLGLAPLLAHPDLEIVRGDIANIRDVVSAIKGVHMVYALAAIVGDPACGIDAETTLNLNYESTKLLVEACNFYGVRRLVFASSCSVYGAARHTLNENSSLNPQSLYARTRIMSEEVIFERCGDVIPVILRLSTVFGLSRRMRFDLVVNLLTAQAVTQGAISVFGGEQWRPFVHCQDAADAFLLAGTVPDERVRKQVFNVGGDALNFTVDRIADLIVESVPGVRVNRMGNSPDPRDYRVAFDKIATLGFRPKFDIVAGIREIQAEIARDPRLGNFKNPIFSNVEAIRERLELHTKSA